MPTYNRAWCLDQAIQSVLTQTFQDFELIVIDDGSTDNTLAVLERYRKEEQVKFFYESHRGRSAARNKGIEESRGEYIAFLDSDDLWFNDKLERQVSFLQDHPEIGAVHGPIEMIDSKGCPLPQETSRLRRLFKKVEKTKGDYTSLSESALFFLSTVLMRKKCLEDAGPFDLNFASREDLDLCLRVALVGYRIICLKGGPVVRYRYRGKSHAEPGDLQAQLRAYYKHLKIFEEKGYSDEFSKARRNFLLLISECYYYLKDFKRCRQFLFQALRMDPLCLGRWNCLRNLIVSFLPRWGGTFPGQAKEGSRHPAVILSHAGIQYSYQLASALQEARFLRSFFTTIYHSGDPRPLPFFIHRYAGRRHFYGLQKELIVSNPWPEFFQKILGLILRKNYFATSHVMTWCNSIFDYNTSRRLKNFDFDIFIGLSGGSLESLKAAKAAGKISIVDQHDIHFNAARRILKEEIELHPEFASSIPYWPPYEPYLDKVQKEFGIADFILVPSSFALQSHLAEGIPKEKLILMPHGFRPWSEEIIPAPLEGETFRILFVGTLTQRKGIKYLLEAVRQLNLPKIELTMIGDQMVDSKALDPYREHFRYIRYTPYPLLGNFFKNAHLLVLPSVYDAFGMVALDAMGAGLPVIVSENTAAGSDVVRNGTDGYVVPIRNIEALKNRIEILYSNRSLLHEMGNNARERVKQFSWDQYKNRLQKTLTEIYSSNGKN